MAMVEQSAPSLLLTVEQAAQVLNISRTRAYELVLSKPPELESVKIGRTRRVPVAALEAFVEGLRSASIGA